MTLLELYKVQKGNSSLTYNNFEKGCRAGWQNHCQRELFEYGHETKKLNKRVGIDKWLEIKSCSLQQVSHTRKKVFEKNKTSSFFPKGDVFESSASLPSWSPGFLKRLFKVCTVTFWKIVCTLKTLWLSAVQAQKSEQSNVAVIFSAFFLCQGCKNSHFPFFTDTMVEWNGWLDINKNYNWEITILIILKCLLNKAWSEKGKWKSSIWRGSLCLDYPF